MKPRTTLAALLITLAAASAQGADTMKELQRATLGGGCFWCLEAVFEELDGVKGAVSGYAGGEVDDPSYQEVCNGNTGHAEVVQVEFDPERISYAEILEVFFSIHDPTTRNRQGADVGTQYRSIILTHDAEQERVATVALAALRESKLWPRPAVTELASLDKFYTAENHHQDYYSRNTAQGYCQVVISPKLDKFRKKFAERLKASN